jgi:hypothetical protein
MVVSYSIMVLSLQLFISWHDVGVGRIRVSGSGSKEVWMWPRWASYGLVFSRWVHRPQEYDVKWLRGGNVCYNEPASGRFTEELEMPRCLQNSEGLGGPVGCTSHLNCVVTQRVALDRWRYALSPNEDLAVRTGYIPSVTVLRTADYYDCYHYRQAPTAEQEIRFWGASAVPRAVSRSCASNGQVTVPDSALLVSYLNLFIISILCCLATSIPP